MKEKNKKIAIGVIVLLAIAAIVFFLFLQPPPAEEEPKYPNVKLVYTYPTLDKVKIKNIGDKKAEGITMTVNGENYSFTKAMCLHWEPTAIKGTEIECENQSLALEVEEEKVFYLSKKIDTTSMPVTMAVNCSECQEEFTMTLQG